MVSRSFVWIDENIEHSEAEEARASALAKKWYELQSREEDRNFRRIADEESGYDCDPYEDCECDFCLKANHDCNEDNQDGSCSHCSIQTELTECESRKEDDKRIAEIEAERELEVELVEDKLAAIGARMMRPYEHWNEDERYMEYMENRGY